MQFLFRNLISKIVIENSAFIRLVQLFDFCGTEKPKVWSGDIIAS